MNLKGNFSDVQPALCHCIMCRCLPFCSPLICSGSPPNTANLCRPSSSSDLFFGFQFYELVSLPTVISLLSGRNLVSPSCYFSGNEKNAYLKTFYWTIYLKRSHGLFTLISVVSFKMKAEWRYEVLLIVWASNEFTRFSQKLFLILVIGQKTQTYMVRNSIDLSWNMEIQGVGPTATTLNF